ncbi:membrane protein [Candidatus Thiomargarita nelsonii]|uniref:Membrane protein n=1 Tax=Candidatus Thiomargarita nelsonii TaxID=1003181 RepID=A0A0A6P1Q0_9GAMM|nr:membrane protein [Candidatus Thiomargarita nelsonii]
MKLVGGLVCLTSGLIFIIIGGILSIFANVQTYVWIIMLVVGFLLMFSSGHYTGEEDDNDNVLLNK